MFVRRVAGLLLLTGCAVAATAQSSLPSPTSITIQSGISELTLSSGFLSALHGSGITEAAATTSVTKPSANGAAIGYSVGYYYSIIGGNLDLTTAKGEIFHVGGPDFVKGSAPFSTVVGFSDLILDTTGSIGGTPAITALVLVDGKVTSRIAVFDAGPPAGFQLPLTLTDGALLSLKGSALTLSTTAASLLNSTFNTTALKGGMSVGTFDTVAGSFNASVTLH